jgi:aspartate aminotransferase
MTIAKHIETIISGSSWIRKMFEEGARLKAEHGAENVYDFSLGNPNLEPPEKFRAALKDAVALSDPGVHAYMPNTGYPHVRKSVADYLCDEQEVQVTENEVIMTCGASGALNVILKAILDPGDEVITPAPFFVEYRYYVDNHGGTLKTVSTKPDFNLDIDAVSAAITKKTRAVLINSRARYIQNRVLMNSEHA